jgi:predicted DNA-binding protein
MRKRPLSITLSPYNRELLHLLANKKDRSLSYIIGWAIERFADHDELGLDFDTLKRVRDKHDIMEPGESDEPDEKANA